MIVTVRSWAALAMSTLLACGHYDFERVSPRTNGDATVGDVGGDSTPLEDAPGDGTTTSADAAAVCRWSNTCQAGQLTCCTPTGATCVVNDQQCTSGQMSECDLSTSAGCDASEICCNDVSFVPRCEQLVNGASPC